MMVSCSIDKIKALEAERDAWMQAAGALQRRVTYLEEKVVIAEELIKAVRELQEAAEGALLVGERR